jgi:microcystin-dependent protein
VPLGAWSEAVGVKGGAATVALTLGELPNHSHRLLFNTGTPGYDFSSATPGPNAAGYDSGTNVEATGGGAPHNNLPPYLRMDYVIKY